VITYYVLAALFLLIVLLLIPLIVLLVRRREATADSPETIAYWLLTHVAKAEGKALGSNIKGVDTDRKWILDTYAECIQAVRTPDKRLG